MKSHTCRFCRTPLSVVLCDLGLSPLANSYVAFDRVDQGEKFYPLKVYVCESCLLAQLDEFEPPDAIFSDYAYFSSFSDSWVEHARRYCVMMKERFGLDASSQAVEIASNDGYLLKHFKAMGIRVLGVEPAANVARVAIEKHGIPTVVQFFGEKTARQLVQDGHAADVLLGANVLAHVPDINDFVGGLTIALKPDGVITFEFPHLLNLIAHNQFDTIYHEHFSYLSFLAVEKIFAAHGLTLFDVEELPTHGGSLRIFARHAASRDPRLAITPRVGEMIAKEIAFGLTDMSTYTRFNEKVRATKRNVLKFLVEAHEQGKTVVAYGAAAKGVTLVNYCGVRDDLVAYVVDRSPYKQNHYLPGVRIPIHPPERIFETKPHYVVILPWNLRREIAEQMAGIRAWGGKFVVPIPEVEVF